VFLYIIYIHFAAIRFQLFINSQLSNNRTTYPSFILHFAFCILHFSFYTQHPTPNTYNLYLSGLSGFLASLRETYSLFFHAKFAKVKLRTLQEFSIQNSTFCILHFAFYTQHSTPNTYNLYLSGLSGFLASLRETYSLFFRAKFAKVKLRTLQEFSIQNSTFCILHFAFNSSLLVQDFA